MSYFRWATLLTIVVMSGAVGCSGSTEVASNDSESSSSETGNRPSRSDRPNRRGSTSQSSGRQVNPGADVGSENNDFPSQDATANLENSQQNDSNANLNASKKREPSTGSEGSQKAPGNSAGNVNSGNESGESAGAKPKKALPTAKATGEKGTNPGDELPDITGKDMDGNPFKLSDYRGKVIMVDFWGDW